MSSLNGSFFSAFARIVCFLECFRILFTAILVCSSDGVLYAIRGVYLNRFLQTDLDLFRSLRLLYLKLHVFVIGDGLVLSYLIEEHSSG